MTAPAPANDNASVIDFRLGDWRVALADVDCVDHLICDPPYSDRTHVAYREMADVGRNPIGYTAWTVDDVEAFVSHWSPRTNGWLVALTDHVLARHWEAAMESAGRYVFAPIACMEPGSRVRLAGDGPAQWSVLAIVSRPKTRTAQKWGALPGGYVVPTSQGWRVPGSGARNGVTGGKPLWLMQQLVRDYSRPGDLICDPTSGGATTLIAAAIEGRRAIGAELDPITFAKAQKRIARGYTPVMRFGDDRPKAVQQELLSAVAGGEER